MKILISLIKSSPIKILTQTSVSQKSDTIKDDSAAGIYSKFSYLGLTIRASLSTWIRVLVTCVDTGPSGPTGELTLPLPTPGMCPLSSLLFSPTPALNTETLEPGSQLRSGHQTLETITRARVKFNDNYSRTIRTKESFLRCIWFKWAELCQSGKLGAN